MHTFCPAYVVHVHCSFGVKPTLETQFHVGVMRTTIDDCQFVCIAQDHYYRILTQGEFHNHTRIGLISPIQRQSEILSLILIASPSNSAQL